jgi:ubiquinone/menaquinone biosynthesis C-methylase UbiE
MSGSAPLDYDELAVGYAAHRAHEPELLELVRRGGNVAPSSHVLEVGCGTGDYIVALQQLTGATCVGVDASAEMLGAARRQSSVVKLIRGRAEALPLADQQFDLVFSVNVIHHVAARPAYFAEARRVLRPGGRLCTVTEDEAMIRARRLSQYFPETVPIELARYPAPRLLHDEVSEAGFTEVVEQREQWPFTVHDAEACAAKVYSCLHLISEDAFARGLAHLERDLAASPLAAEARVLLIWGKRP